MRFVYGFIAFVLWLAVIAWVNKGGDHKIGSDEAWIISLAIVVAGAMVGGG